MRPALPPRHTVLAAALAAASLASLPGAAWAGAGKSVVEGNAGATRAKASIELEMPVPHPLVNVRYRTVDGTATAGRDYVPTSGSVTFGPLDTEKEIRVDVLGDTLYEGDETFYLDTDSATPGDESESRRITIVDDDPAPSVSVSDTTVAEGFGSARFDVSLSAPSGLATTVAYSTADGTATAGSDYVAKSGTLTFAPGETTKPVSVDVVGDAVHEDSETFALGLANPLGATLGTSQAHAAILDDDPATAATPPAATTTPSATTERAATTRVAGHAHGAFAGLIGHRTVALHVSCPAGGGACEEAVRLTAGSVVIGQSRYALAPGSEGDVAVALSRTARSRLAHRGRLALAARFADGSVSRFVVRAARRH